MYAPVSWLTYFCDPKQFKGCFASRQGALLDLNLLEAKAVCVLVKVVQPGPFPLLILLGILLLQATDVLSQFFQDFFLELAFRLARAKLAARPILAQLELGGRRAIVKLPPFGGLGGR